jgi:DNA polymerase III alpha subunit
LNKEDFIIHKTITAIKNRQTLENIDHSNLADEEFYFKDPAQLDKLWRNLPEALENINYIVEQCDVDLKLNQYKYPVFPSSGNSFSLLHDLSYEGLRQRYDVITPLIEDRLTTELQTINELYLSDYFLVVWDILKEAKRRRMMTIGRGSAANSMVSYCLGFTEIDPIKHNLFFERFLNKSRKSPPDIDLDFSWKERDEIVRYVFDKYGYEHVAFISTHVTFKARSAFRETAKAFGFSDREISKISKYIPGTNAAKLPDIPKLFPEAKNLKLDVEPWKSVIKIAARLAGFPRHLSIHPGGIVIAPQPITDYTALEFASNKGVGLIITQPDMHGIEDIGLVKIDLLSQRSLGVVRDTIEQIGINNSKFSRPALRLYCHPELVSGSSF